MVRGVLNFLEDEGERDTSSVATTPHRLPEVKHPETENALNNLPHSFVYTFTTTSYLQPDDQRLLRPSRRITKNNEGQLRINGADCVLVDERAKLHALISEADDETVRMLSILLARTFQHVSQPKQCERSRQLRRDLKTARLQHRQSNGKLLLPTLPAPYRWPKRKYSEAHRKTGVTIEQFLRTTWLDLVAAGYGELRWLRMVDRSAAMAVENYERKDAVTGLRRRLPPEIRFLREREITNGKVLSGLPSAVDDPRLYQAICTRVRRKGAVLIP